MAGPTEDEPGGLQTLAGLRARSVCKRPVSQAGRGRAQLLGRAVLRRGGEGWQAIKWKFLWSVDREQGLPAKQLCAQIQFCVCRETCGCVQRFKGLPILVCFYSFRFVLRFLKFSIMVW